MSKDNCLDLFKNMRVDPQEQILKSNNEKAFIQYKLKKKTSIAYFNTLNMLIAIGAFHKLLYIMVINKKIEIVKKLFIMDIEIGNVMQIPRELSQEDLPASFRFYDPIIRLIQNGMHYKRKEFYYNKSSICQEYQDN